jgi:hypothetical protein
MSDKKFSKLMARYNCTHNVVAQIKDAVVITKIPDDDVEPGSCLIKVVDVADRFILPPRITRYFYTEFVIFYLLERIPTSKCPFIDLTFWSIEEISVKEYEIRRADLPEEQNMKAAEKIINCEYISD